MAVCEICYSIHNGYDRYCSMACQAAGKTDQARWDAARKCAFESGWIPSLTSYFCLATLEPRGRFRFIGAILVEKRSTGWFRLGVAGGPLWEVDDAPLDFVPDHSPWPRMEYSSLAGPLLDYMVEEIPEDLRREYSRMIRSFARKGRVDRLAASDIGPPPGTVASPGDPGNTPPYLLSWAARGLLDEPRILPPLAQQHAPAHH